MNHLATLHEHRVRKRVYVFLRVFSRMARLPAAPVEVRWFGLIVGERSAIFDMERDGLFGAWAMVSLHFALNLWAWAKKTR